jgi:hypothetical protein
MKHDDLGEATGIWKDPKSGLWHVYREEPTGDAWLSEVAWYAKRNARDALDVVDRQLTALAASDAIDIPGRGCGDPEHGWPWTLGASHVGPYVDREP